MTGGERRPAIIIAATPTSNGDLHVGHLAGPYLAGDIYARYLRANGRPVTYTTCTDDSQSYVVTTAHRRQVTPAELVSRSTAAIQRTLEATGISMAPLPPIDEKYRRTVLGFLGALRALGRFRLRTVRLPYAQHAGTFLYDGLVSGVCPHCLANSSGGGCENCGHPNNYDELLEPVSSLDPADPVTHRDATILVLPLEEYRERLTAYFAEHAERWRPHARQLVRELLARPLPDVPVTVPGSWGIAAPFPETPGQVLYPWVEAMPASMYSTWQAAGAPAEATDRLWRRENDAELVYFHGFDNVYHWGLMDLVFLMAHGDRYVTPAANVCNEFYDLDGEKFSTSRNHLVWAADLVAEVPRDLVRFYLALTGPECQRTNFDRAALTGVIERRLVRPWNALSDALSLALSGVDIRSPLPVTVAGQARAELLRQRFRACYELADYSPARAAETVLSNLGRMRAAAEALDRGEHGGTIGDLLLEIRTLLAGAAPILADAAAEAADDGVDLRFDRTQPGAVPAFLLPLLPSGARPAADRSAELATVAGGAA
ncbi:class I tRNA ligase family protein [Actinoplanes sp. NPDC026623]|uniref:class I tRNA ligase family protein n=1 Tax=Actinoplanes sp. NPDC026623 TaxID=3155610 RepID=UPI0033FBF3AD